MNAPLPHAFVAELPGRSPASMQPLAHPANPLDRATRGQLPLGELLDLAQRWQDQGQLAQAAELYRLWLAHTPDRSLCHVASFNHGTVLAALGQDAEAEAAYRLALSLSPHFPQALLNLGHTLERRGAMEDALQQWRAVLAHTAATAATSEPGSPADTLPLRLHALNNLARLNEQLRRFDQAEAWMVQSLTLKPDQFDVLQHFVHIRQKQCEWPLYQPEPPVGQVTPYQLLVGTSPLAMLSVSDDPALQLLAAQRFVHERVMRPPAQPLWRSPQAGRRDPDGRLRIGYLSGDLCLHAVGLLTVELLELHDRQRCEVHAFSWSRDDGTPLSARLRRAVDHHHALHPLDDHAAAQLIAQQGIDVLVDLQGLTSGARPNILAQRPAPVQVSYLGFPGTCALPGVDWIVADRFVMPDALRPYCSEQPIYLPHCYQVSDRQRDVGPTPLRADLGLPENAFVYCSFNNNFKFTEEVFATWMRVLHAVPHSVLWLLADNDWARANMQACAQAHGVDANRLIFAPRAAPPDYLARFAVADLMLDTFPYNAGTTANDALWMGLPILTLAGRSYISRMAGSLLHAVGLPELITDTLADYEATAIRLGRHPARVHSLKRYLAEHGRHSPLFDIPGRVRALEDALASRVVLARA